MFFIGKDEKEARVNFNGTHPSGLLAGPLAGLLTGLIIGDSSP